MSSEQTGKTQIPAAITPSTASSPGSAATPSDLMSHAPYDATTMWRPWPAVIATIIICLITLAIALVGVQRTATTTSATAVMSKPILLTMLLAQVVMILGALLAARAKGGHLVSVLALKPPQGGAAAYIKGLLILMASAGLFTAISAYGLGHDTGTDLKPMADVIRGKDWPLVLIMLGLGAPISEELLFRGFLQSALVPTRLGYWGASIVTTALWTAMHAGYSIIGIIEVFLIGLIFCSVLRHTGSLRVTMAAHAIYNTLVAIVVMFAPKQWLGF